MIIISGGQTGVDRAALDAAIDCGIEHGGWCPKGRIAEDGQIGSRYCLKETEKSDYETRTETNVTASDGTLIICRHEPNVGTLLTILLCARHGKPVLWIRPKQYTTKTDLKKTLSWIRKYKISTLNCAGPRLTKDKDIYNITYDFLCKLIDAVKSNLF